MNYYKFISENEIRKFTGGFVVIDDIIYTNPKPEHLSASGYKPLVHAEDPEYDIDKQYIVITYSDEENYIQEIKTVKDIPEESSYEIEQEEE